MIHLSKQLERRPGRVARLLIHTTVALSLVLTPALATAQQAGAIGGKVVAADTRQPLSGVIVNVQGTSRGTLTDIQGQYRIDAVPSGTVVVVARVVGRDAARDTVIVPPAGSASQDFALMQTAVRVGDVVVTANREAQTKTEIPANIGVVGGADIQLARPHHSAEIVNRVPGVLNIDLGGEGSTVAMRLPINYSAVYGYLEDGVPIRSTGFFNHNALYEINVPGAGRVEVFKGPATAMYGSDAIGGVFNVLTRTPSAASDLELFAEGAAHDYRRILASVSNTWSSDGLRADLNLMHFGGWRDGANQDRQTGTVRWDHALPADARLKTVVTFTNIDSPGDGGSDIPYSDFQDRPSMNYTPIAMRKVKAFRWSTDYSKQMGSSGVDVTAYARYNRLELLPFWQLTYDPQIWDADNRSVGLMAKYRRDFARGNVIVGTDFDYSPGRNVEDEIIPSMTPNYVFNSYTMGQRQYDYDVTFRGASPYAQVELSPIDGLHLSAGVRLDELKYVYDNKLSALDSGSHRRPASTSVSYSHVSPKIGITYDATSSVNVFASYRHGFRVPSQEQLFVQGSASNSVGLQPVRANSYEVGIRTALSRVSAELSAYSMDMTDDIVYFYNEATYTSEVSNAGRTKHRGVEAGVKVALTDQWRVESSYAYVRNRYSQWVTATGSDFSGNEMEAGPRTIANSRLTYAPSANSAVSAEWAHVGWYYTDPANLHRYNGYDVMNLELATPARNGFAIVGRLANVTNKRYSVASSFNPFVPADQQDRYTPGSLRTLYFGLQYKQSR